ncbi:uracil-DNA glycosylase family protein [Thermosipho sp. (in: thermotogales)]|jgi:uracil-DNA glycosylase family 4|uniref:uracil-DNA glycosylase family protein n=1 Tax=Thermosipho sp. (in: thermotogales) TaxID=1968895 RepID=UPI00257C6B20|nr:uracil-DNA glycosylase family protein [Thermosipho sp. (in: thermotogales)]MBZ4649282.1 uracil-DNA glycosylase [Thermosipho sp. (in: thermotogales)]
MAKIIKNPKLSLLYAKMYRCKKCKDLIKMSCNIYDGKSNGPLRGGGDSINCKVMFVGQNPSYRRFENTNCAFSGGFGDDFRKLLDEVGIKEHIFITNIVKCSTLNNSKPDLNIINNCEEYLLSELEIIKPEIIVPMGQCSVSYFNGTIGKLTNFKNYKVFSIYHPNFILSYKRNKLKDYIFMLKKIYKIAYEEKS